MRIGQKLVLGFVGIALLGAVVGYVGVRGSRAISQTYDEIVDETAPALLALGKIQSSIKRIQMEALSISLIGAEKEFAATTAVAAVIERELEELEEAKERLEYWENEFDKFAEDPLERQFVQDIEKTGVKLYRIVHKLIDAKKKGLKGESILAILEELEEAEEEFISVTEKAIENERRELIEGDEAADKLASGMINLIIIVAIATVILAIVLGYFISKAISRPITKLRDAANEIGKGDLSKRAEVKSKDEIGELAASFNQMADEVQKRNEELQTMNEELRSTNEEMETSNEELQSTTEELEASNEELRTTQEELVQKEKLAAVGQLASGVGHELRNPLGVIKNAVYYIKTKVGTEDSKLVKHLNIMEREIRNSNKIISDLLGFSRIRPPAISPQDINKIMEDSLEVVEIPENIKLVKELGDDLSNVMTDPDQIRQVFVNLSLNAVQAMAEGGELKIVTRREGDFIETSFSDTGCGISEENLKQLFDPFFTTKARGIGLGLAVTKGIIERHNGVIDVKSEVNKSTTFVVKLPVEKKEK